MTSRRPLGRLGAFHEAGIVGVADVHVAGALLEMCGESLVDSREATTSVALGIALCVRALRSGSVCVDVSQGSDPWLPEGEVVESSDALEHLSWPEPQAWLEALAGHPLVSVGAVATCDRPLRIVGSRLYLQRYWADEQVIREAFFGRRDLLVRSPDPLHENPEVDARLEGALDRLFPRGDSDLQRLAAATALLRRITIVAGGPGTGKTTTVARIVALIQEAVGGLNIALAAPTGKAAARLSEAVTLALNGLDETDRQRVGNVQASTLHRLLGSLPGRDGRFRHDRGNPLPHDVVIVDETSMVSLPLMARLIEAVRLDARLILVGDPDQLASIDAGVVLGDLVHARVSAQDGTELLESLNQVCPKEDRTAVERAARSGVVVLDRNYRFGGAIGALAAAIRDGQAEQALRILEAGSPDVQFLDTVADPGELARAENTVLVDVSRQASRVLDSAIRGDATEALAALDAHRVLCAHREGPFGVRRWNDLIASWTTGFGPMANQIGRPLLITANDYNLGLFNGDTGVIVAGANGPRAVFARGNGIVEVPPVRLTDVQTLHAMTVHRGQGSQFDAVTVVLPPDDSPLLTRELLYTAVTRARTSLRVIGTEQSLRAGVDRQVRRASGLRS